MESSDAVRRVVIPARTRRAVRVPARRPGVAMPAELRDLPATTPLDAGAAIAKPDTAMHSVAAVALDPSEPDALFAVALEREPDATATNAIARVDLATRSWRWQRSDGCGPGTPVELALAADVVACAARGTMSTVRATSRGGSARWQWETDHIDRLQGAGAVVLAYDADRLTVLDAATGRPQGRFASDDGAAVRAAAVVVDATTWLVTFERGRIVARVTSVGMIATWSMRVDGVVRDLAASGDGVLVDLEDGDAYRIDLRTLQVTALPGLGLDWRAAGELITGHIAGGPIPGVEAAHVRVATPPRLAFDRFGRSLTPDRSPEAPVLWVPISPPPPLGESWQYALFERTGGLRARNDYALAPPIAPTTVRGPSGSPLVVTYGPQMREALVLDPRTGDPLRRIALPETGLVFGTIVDGTPVAGVVLGAPLRVVVF